MRWIGMTEQQAVEILERIAAAYTQFDLTGKKGERRMEVWIEQLIKMDYRQVLKNLNNHILYNKFPPAISEIAAEEKPVNDFLEQKQTWEKEVNAEKKIGLHKTFIDYLPEKLKEKYAFLTKEN